jgi:hypothetical protein
MLDFARTENVALDQRIAVLDVIVASPLKLYAQPYFPFHSHVAQYTVQLFVTAVLVLLLVIDKSFTKEAVSHKAATLSKLYIKTKLGS